jgi:very-short-patch-repair endonuclease
MPDFGYYKQRMVEELRRCAPNPLSPGQLADRISGDRTNAGLFASIADAFPDTFLVFQNGRIRLQPALLENLVQEPEPELEISGASASRAVNTYANQIPPQVLAIGAVRFIQFVRDKSLYEVGVEIDGDELRPADDTPVELVLSNGKMLYGQVAGGSKDGALLYVALERPINEWEHALRLKVNRKAAWLQIGESLGAIGQLPPLCRILIGNQQTARIESHNSLQVADQLSYAPTPWARLLWGPPGAGKTFALARLTERLLSDPRERVLLLAPSNTAVDAATLEVVSALRESTTGGGMIESRAVFRFGYPKDDRVLAVDELFGPPRLSELSAEIRKANSEIQRLTRTGASERELATERTKRKSLQDELKRCMASHIGDAKVVATTISLALGPSSPVLTAGNWGTIIADEVSMIGGAVVLLLSSLAQRRLLLAGDPRQLAPILEWNSGEPPVDVQAWLGRDAFAWAASPATASAGFDGSDQRMARILSQRRCHPGIWSCVSSLYPAVRTEVDVEVLNRLALSPPFQGAARVILDLSSGRKAGQIPEADDDVDVAARFESACRKTGKSWSNPPTAALAIDVAREVRAALPKARIAIIAPYRAQVRLISNWLSEEAKVDGHLKTVEVGTVHSFQGGEADVVIFDVVDGPPRTSLGGLLSSEAGLRLVNVAVTRGRGKLVVIGDRAWILEKSTAAEAGLLRTLFAGDGVAETIRVVPPRPTSGFRGGNGPAPESPIEELLYTALRKRRNDIPQVVLQHVIVNQNRRIVSRPDFAFTGERVAIFCDGARYHLQKDQWRRDQRQRRGLVALGWRVLVFTGAEINEDAEACVDEIVRCLREI